MTKTKLPNYQLLERTQISDFEVIGILDGQFANVEFHFHTVKIDYVGEDDVPKLKFSYRLIKDRGKVIFNEQAFEDTLALILVDLMMQQPINKGE